MDLNPVTPQARVLPESASPHTGGDAALRRTGKRNAFEVLKAGAARRQRVITDEVASSASNAFDTLMAAAKKPGAFDPKDDLAEVMKVVRSPDLFDERADVMLRHHRMKPVQDFVDGLPSKFREIKKWSWRRDGGATDTHRPSHDFSSAPVIMQSGTAFSYDDDDDDDDEFCEPEQPTPASDSPLDSVRAHLDLKSTSIVGVSLQYCDGTVTHQGDCGQSYVSEIVWSKPYSDVSDEQFISACEFHFAKSSESSSTELLYRPVGMRVRSGDGAWHGWKKNYFDDRETQSDLIELGTGRALWSITWPGIIGHRPAQELTSRALNSLRFESPYESSPRGGRGEVPSLVQLCVNSLQRSSRRESISLVRDYDRQFADLQSSYNARAKLIFEKARAKLRTCNEAATLQRAQAVAAEIVRRAEGDLSRRQHAIQVAAKEEFYDMDYCRQTAIIAGKRSDAVSEMVSEQDSGVACLAGLPGKEGLRMCRVPTCRKMFKPAQVPLASRCRQRGLENTPNFCLHFFCGCESLLHCDKCNEDGFCRLCFDDHQSWCRETPRA